MWRGRLSFRRTGIAQATMRFLRGHAPAPCTGSCPSGETVFSMIRAGRLVVEFRHGIFEPLPGFVFAAEARVAKQPAV